MGNSKQKWIKLLKTARIFYSLPLDEVEILAALMFYAEFDDGRPLVYEGEPGNELFIIVSGTVAVSVKSEGKDIELIRLGAGDFFGEMAMLEEEARSATCTAVGSVSCLVLKSRDFLSLIEKQPRIAAEVLRSMLNITSGRLLNTDSLLSQIIQWGDDAKKRAITDEFTGLYNRRYLEESFETLLKRSLRQHIGVSFAMVDVDHFGTLNKTYGAPFCDKILLDITKVFNDSFDTDDILIRYGGDEFCFIIRGELSQAKKQCNRVCKGVNSLEFPEYPDLRVSCSIGLAEYKNNLSTAELSKLADEALYIAKEGGRNQVAIKE